MAGIRQGVVPLGGEWFAASEMVRNKCTPYGGQGGLPKVAHRGILSASRGDGVAAGANAPLLAGKPCFRPVRRDLSGSGIAQTPFDEV